MIQRLQIHNPEEVINRLLQMRLDNHFLCQCAELKWLFRPYLDDKEIWNSWWNDMRQSEMLPLHQDHQGCTMYCFYLKGSSPVVVEDIEYPIEPGLFISFPSSARHGVPRVTEEHRLSLVIEASPNIKPGIDFVEYA